MDTTTVDARIHDFLAQKRIAVAGVSGNTQRHPAGNLIYQRLKKTGHQVFATVHASRAAQTIERIIAMFPPAEHKVLLGQLAHSLEAIISQRLVVMREQGAGRRPGRWALW